MYGIDNQQLIVSFFEQEVTETTEKEVSQCLRYLCFLLFRIALKNFKYSQ
jgi:hypothetical protein